MQNQHYLTVLLVLSLNGLACVAGYETTDTNEVLTESAAVSTRGAEPMEEIQEERFEDLGSVDTIRRTSPSPIVEPERRVAVKSTDSRQQTPDEKAKEDVELNPVETNSEATELKSTEAWTAMDQGSSRRDVNITRSIRRQVSGDKSLSVYARNIVIITRDGIVALKGIVRSDEEKALAESIARDVEGVTEVSNHLNIRPR